MQIASVSKSNTRFWSGIALVITGAILLSAKGILSKMLYAEGLDFQEVITFRSILSLPLFWLWAIYSVGLTKLTNIVDRRAVVGAICAGIFCYYIGGSLDFYALTLIDASLERVLLYTYPAVIVIGTCLWQRRKPTANILIALVMTYAGIILTIGVFDMSLWKANSLGSILVLICAVTYGGYYIANDLIGQRVGSVAFTVYAMTSATVALCIHFSLTHSINDIVSLTPRSWYLFLIMVTFVTVVPLFMLAEGVKQIGAQRASLLSTVGPASTIILATIILGESMEWFQYLGVLITLAGIVILEWKHKPPEAISD
jgi:drug/metabolite transporter (DMT)-like permease